MTPRRTTALLETLLLTAAALLAPLFWSSPSQARACAFNDSGCWRDHSGVNHSSLAVGPGVACAIVAATQQIFGHEVLCYVPNGPTWASRKLPPTNMSQVFGNTPATRIRAIAIQGSQDLLPGPFTLWLLRGDGTLFVSRGDSRFRDSRDEMKNFVQISGQSSIKTLSVVRPTWSLSSFPMGAKSTGELYAYENGWSPIAPAGQYALAFGGPLGALGIKGSQRSGKDLELFYWNIVPNLIPPIPGNLTLAPFDYLMGQVQPIALGLEDAWLLTNSADIATRIYRSTRGAVTWNAWAPYLTGTFPDFDVPPLLPWSIVDARAFRGRRGELMVIGDSNHLLSYVP
jgi:hypothetical protein